MCQRAFKKIDHLCSVILVRLIIAYRLVVSVHLGQCCRFYPSCSEYALIAIRRFGCRSFGLILKRFLSCHPFCIGGVDLVPEREKK